MKNENGFSYLEVLVSLAILSIFLIPVLITVERASDISEAAVDRYKAQLLTGGLLLDVEERLDILLADSAPDLQWLGFNGAYDFDRLYETERFQYLIQVFEITDGEKSTVLHLSIGEPDSPEEIELSGISEAYLILASVSDKNGELLCNMSKVVPLR